MPKRCMVAGCIVYSRGKVLLIRHKKLGKWLYPGGHMESWEFPDETAVRETKEETGIDVKILSGKGGSRLKFSGAAEQPAPFAIMRERVPYRDGAHIHFDILYAARPLSMKGMPDRSETDGMGWFSKNEVAKLDTYENVRALLMKFFSIHA